MPDAHPSTKNLAVFETTLIVSVPQTRVVIVMKLFFDIVLIYSRKLYVNAASFRISILEVVGDSGLTRLNLASLRAVLLVVSRATCIKGQ